MSISLKTTARHVQIATAYTLDGWPLFSPPHGVSSGDVIGGQYRLLRALAHGAIDEVWYAESDAGTPVAIKFLDPAIGADPRTRAAFLAEADAALKIRAETLVAVLGAGMSGASPYVVLDLVEGDTLEEALFHRPLRPAELKPVLSSVVAALEALHARGLAHGQLRPAKVLLPRAGDLCGTRLALAFASATTDMLALARNMSGTRRHTLASVAYMSPESIRDGAVGDGSDLWSLAIIACECLTGQLPFAAATMGDRLVNICSGSGRVPSALGAVPAGFDAWFARAVSRHPEQRFASARELGDALIALL